MRELKDFAGLLAAGTCFVAGLLACFDSMILISVVLIVLALGLGIFISCFEIVDDTRARQKKYSRRKAQKMRRAS